MGTFIEENGEFRKISEEHGGWIHTLWNKRNDLLIGGTYANITKYTKGSDNKWVFKGTIPGLHESCRELLIDSLDNIWVSHGSKGIYKIRLSEEKDSVISVKLYNNNGLPSEINNYIFKLFNQIIVCANEGVYKYNYSTDKFEEAPFFNQLFGRNNKIRNPKLDEKGNIWFYRNDYPALLMKEGTDWRLIDAPFLKYGNIYVNSFENSEIINYSNILFGTEKGFIHFNLHLIDTAKAQFETLIRSVKLTKPSDSLVFNGNLLSLNVNRKELSVSYKTNAIKFTFVAPIYESSDKTQYRFKLDGFEKNWSAWNNNTEKEYTNLSPGVYSFHVESKNILGQIGTKASFQFTVNPPWYRTNWAFAGYLIILIICGYLAYLYVKLRFNRAKQSLKKKEQEKLRKKEEEFAKESLLKEQKIIKLKNEKLESEVLQRKTQMELKNKELASVAIQITHKNEILTSLKSKIESISVKVNNQAQLELRQLIKKIDEDLKLDKDWDQFKLHFEEVHADFFRRLQDNYEELTPKDLKMCAYLRMNLSTKEIAPLMSISVRGVEISRYRLRKKLGLQKDANLIDFMLNL